MKRLGLSLGAGAAPKILCLGAHSDDIEIGCGATVLRLLAEHPAAEVMWVVLSATGKREAEARASAAAFLAGAARSQVAMHSFRDGFFPYVGVAVKECFEAVKGAFDPDLIFTHCRDDKHQDHRLTCELTYNTYRDHLILEYEVPKYDGDLGSPNLYVPVAEPLCGTKIELLGRHFPSQAGKDWFSDDVFWSLLRLRGVECRSESRFAEAFYLRKAVL